MERLAGQTKEAEGSDASAIDLLDRVWRMHPEVSPTDILACALDTQVRHLSRLPVGGGWMMRFLRELPTFVPADAPIPVPPSVSLTEDVVDALELRYSSHRGDGNAVYRDAAHICHVALRYLTPGTVCRISIRAYQQT